MLKMLTLTLVTFLTVGASASELLNCEMQQHNEGNVTSLSFQVEATDSPHGSIFMFKADQFQGVSGFVARMMRADREFVVMNIQSDSPQVASSSQHEVIAGANQYFHHQLLLPSRGLGINGVVLDCQF